LSYHRMLSHLKEKWPEGRGIQEFVRLSKFIKPLTKLDLVVLDELGFIPFSKEGGQVLFQLCSDLNERVSIIITTNLRFADWNGIFGDEIMTTSLLDRLTSKGHILEFVGESYRFRQRMQLEEQAASEQAR
jgi:DNA replication protein DnaC